MLSRLATVTDEGLLSGPITPTTSKKSSGVRELAGARWCVTLAVVALLTGRNCSALPRAVTGVAQSSAMIAPSVSPDGRRRSSLTRLISQ